MNPIKAFYCRTVQAVLRAALPVLPYRDPEIFRIFRERLLPCSRRPTTTTSCERSFSFWRKGWNACGNSENNNISFNKLKKLSSKLIPFLI